MKKLYLLGHPVSHSLSPVMQNAAIKSLGLDWEYSTLDVAPEDLAATLERLEADPDVVGCNVTVPHKVAVFEWLDPDQRKPEANLFGAVNTLVKTGEGRFQGTSTDFAGAVIALQSEGFHVGPLEDAGMLQEHDIAILGTGGSAQSLAIGLATHRSTPRSITIFGRNQAKATEIARKASDSPRDPIFTDLRLDSFHLADFAAWNKGRKSVVIQTTTVGMDSGEAPGQSPVPAGSVGKGQIAFDIVYKPHETPFLIDAKPNGATIVHGINMLVGQGVWSLQRWVQQNDPDLLDNYLDENVVKPQIFDPYGIMSVMRQALGIR